MNTYIRLNLDYLAASGGGTVTTSETTTSTTFADLTTVGPTITFPGLGTSAIVMVSGLMQSSTTNFCLMSWAISGATTQVARDSTAAFMQGTSQIKSADVFYASGLTAGSNTFTAKYRVSGGTGTFLYRNLTVIPLP